ncbi:UDP-N-acetylmuramoyl-L-alanine--D-glutamate ligase [Pontibacillus yanchengensis]|uniref:UDP-N-acetylmuramoyl-L-alanine--D-glutamate ligase n=2 Tax=Pontibacillus yanchengensis TaxID=462910 RepID=A0ACC7VBQ6_9BACI|nr:UDP-N-acetylmuramoyl-L-alanine--D-glutamate ligase [Pontibacillus yanchengensis]MYL33048.1 UDP-N-acetylmuramoyl-L-alanine--D-glutamate ligase [Pontibacillus yanchengensis]MYL52102.1 UDP-N-acetylmuramoyl-L-alanine--D-glutamate ligase [Pontibacillus yanchengensis]
MRQLIDFPYKHVLVLGLAKSGEAAAKLLHHSGVQVRVNDQKPYEENPQARTLGDLGIDVITGSHPMSVLDGIDYVVKNPGIPYTNPIVDEAMRRELPVVTEVELAYRLNGDNMIGITGSNGKTTTTTLVYEMLKANDKGTKLAGNIGEVACEVAQTTSEKETMVVELSSFQLIGTETFKPHIAVFLNLYEAHLDYHKTMEHYAWSKSQLFAHQQANDFLVYNADQEIVRELVASANSQRVPFSLENKQPLGIWCDEEFLYYQDECVIALKDIMLAGKHNLENIMAAVGAAKLSGVTNKGIQQVLRTFSGVEHRMQFVKEVQGRNFYNDSKATNMLATKNALEAFEQPTILLAGGLDRGNALDDLGPYLKNVKAMILFGETAPKFKQLAIENGIETYDVVDNVKQAAEKAYRISEAGDVILLSPACASWDQYRTFEERGDMFMDAVHTLK